MNKACKDIEKLSRMTVIHICSSHMLNTGRRHFKSLKIQKDELDVAMETVSNLIHCTTVQAAEHVFEVMIRVFMVLSSVVCFNQSLDYIIASTLDRRVVMPNDNKL
ncbi:hypothetical protein KQX54_013020 [Cotesia glomerata]|uniref:Uncharacterized protein n=1 Tax=Cotesia glomerata TaxID=32391 RepID=A0AAV7IQ68_COTGL|nr:hypothetical protein KQX54_013020 [Cotesia glomerata]